MANWLTYSNQGATRSQPLNPQLVNALGGFVPDLGLTMNVFSGGQPASGPNRVGSHRHDYGNAGDVMFLKDGRALNWASAADRPIFEQIVRRGRSAGITGFGAGEGYMRPGSMHIGFGSPGVWGAGGSGANAPDWLRAAFSGGSPGRAGPLAAPGAVPPTEAPGTTNSDPFSLPSLMGLKSQDVQQQYNRPLPFEQGFGGQQLMQGLIGGTLKQDLRASIFRRIAGLFA